MAVATFTDNKTAKNLTQHAVIISKIEARRRQWNMDRETWRKAAVGMARIYRNLAPESIRPLLTGKLSLLPKSTIFICETFLLVLSESDERAQGAGVTLDMARVWQAAAKLAAEVGA